ncbi:adenosine deaminase family protein [Grosmannia clavigera kw1407]|uniref:Adenosine deaminase family protein n=1 Tax=Grosmannia clavigera (strain kw1407 / UAMH 11150) TaxID=655863 RepID=F0XGV3_GROCL|nr:adenosine deaminase family protein [Grosmannia clavigera kw1407]EFX02860.1 adenosine deaminase family protein [Grosmannia clavigera kw1407]
MSLAAPESLSQQSAFDQDLQASRVYKRTIKIRNSMTLLSSTALYTTALSMFSNISFCVLPIYSTDLSNSFCYVFGEEGALRSDRQGGEQERKSWQSPEEKFLYVEAFLSDFGPTNAFKTYTEIPSASQEFSFDTRPIVARFLRRRAPVPSTTRATSAETLANHVIMRLKLHDAEVQSFDQVDQEHAHIAGNNFLTNEQLISGTQLLRVAEKMPKGAHLRINFNSHLLLTALLDVASSMRQLLDLALMECLNFKKRWPNYIAGFDLVAEETKGHRLREFVPKLLAFQNQCTHEGFDIPFLFQCDETLDIGTEVDNDLVDALLLGAKRIGRGFAMPRHSRILHQMKQRGICVEMCPTSNELLGLTPRISGRLVNNMLAENMPCTINSDNGMLIRSSLSYNFYRIIVGKADMGLFGWRQLAEWSLEHACLSNEELAEAMGNWLEAWCHFVVWLLDIRRPQ